MTRWKTGVVIVILAAGGASAAACTDDDVSDGAGPELPGSEAGAPETGAPGDGGASDATTPLSGSAAEFCDSTFGLVKRALEGCCTATDQATRDYAGVHGLIEAFLPLCTSTLEASVAKGRVAFHADQASTCYGAYASNYAPSKCSNLTQTYTSPAGGACKSVFTGVGAEGAACAGDHECSDGLTCVGYTKTADGACHAPGAVGAACGPQREDGGSNATFDVDFGFGVHPACTPDARCSSATSRCVTAAPAGNACVGDEDCASPLLCHLYLCGTSGPAAAGGACKTEDDCVRGLYCERPTNDDGVCAAKKSAGGSCTGAPFQAPECSGRCDADAGAAGSCASFCGSP